MKFFGGILLFLIVFLAAGVGIHYALYSKPGVFVWSCQKDASTGEHEFTRTTVAFESPADEKASAKEEKTPEKESASSNKKAPAKAAKPKDPNLVALFNGKDLGEWQKTQFGGEGDVFVNEDGNLEFDFGAIMTGVHWGGKVPATSNYEITLEAMKLDGNDFFCALTFPVKESHASLIIGGWGGGIVGISCVDDLNASENETMNVEGFEDNVWYKIRVKVTDDKLDAWINDDQLVDLDLKDRKISLLPGDVELCVPIGIASFITRAQYRNIEWRNLPKKP